MDGPASALAIVFDLRSVPAGERILSCLDSRSSRSCTAGGRGGRPAIGS